ncbi:MAG: thioredoxin-disulfide reductase [Pseudomonadota bacterium]
MTDETQRHQVLIIGSGPAGYTAAIYAARANLNPVVVQGTEPGGQLMVTTDVENYPGFRDIIQGPWLMDEMKAQAENVGTKVVHDMIVDVNFTQKPFVCTGDSGTKYTADAVIISTGAQAKWLGIPSEEKLRGFGVSGCATCDAFFFRDKIVAVIGGGDTAAEDALFLTRHASKIYVVHRRDQLRAEKVLQDRMFANPKIEFIWNHVVDEILGTDNPKSVTGLRLKDVGSGKLKELSLDGVFIAIGHTPATGIFKGKLNMDEHGYILCTPGSTATNVEGVFAAGDVQDKVYRQAVTAAGLGCMAALDAERYLASQQK